MSMEEDNLKKYFRMSIQNFSECLNEKNAVDNFTKLSLYRESLATKLNQYFPLGCLWFLHFLFHNLRYVLKANFKNTF